MNQREPYVKSVRWPRALRSPPRGFWFSAPAPGGAGAGAGGRRGPRHGLPWAPLNAGDMPGTLPVPAPPSSGPALGRLCSRSGLRTQNGPSRGRGPTPTPRSRETFGRLRPPPSCGRPTPSGRLSASGTVSAFRLAGTAPCCGSPPEGRAHPISPPSLLSSSPLSWTRPRSSQAQSSALAPPLASSLASQQWRRSGHPSTRGGV